MTGGKLSFKKFASEGKLHQLPVIGSIPRQAGDRLSLPARPAVESTSDSQSDTERIGWSTLIHYAAPLAPAYLLYMMVTVVFMNFATDVLLIAPGIIGTIFLGSKLWDAVSDPVIGYLSDKSRSRIGRRKVWMYASVLPLVATTIMLWSPPAHLTDGALVTWVAVSVVGFYTAFTLFYVPQMALGIELTPSPHERSRVFAGRQIALTLGMWGAFLVATPLILDNPAARENAALLATAGALVLGLTLLITTKMLPRDHAPSGSESAAGPIAATRDVLQNPHARLLLFVYFIEIFGIGATSAMTPYILIYVTKASSYVGIVFFFYSVPAIASIPFWVWMGKRYERHKLWRFAMGLQAIGYGLIVFQAEGRVGLMIASSLINGFATACGQTLGYAIKGDVIDYDEHRSGQRKEGSYLAAWNLAMKFGTGLMIAISGWALQASGFVPNVEQTDTVIWTIKGMTGGVPFVCILIGMIAFSRFSLDSREAARIRSELEARKLTALGRTP